MITITKTSGGYAVSVPYALKNDFRAAFPSAAWKPALKAWKISAQNLEKVQAWASAQTPEAIAVAETEMKARKLVLDASADLPAVGSLVPAEGLTRRITSVGEPFYSSFGEHAGRMIVVAYTEAAKTPDEEAEDARIADEARRARRIEEAARLAAFRAEQAEREAAAIKQRAEQRAAMPTGSGFFGTPPARPRIFKRA